ncbi:unnamed protein product [Thlaspi arvense]|uniref:DUF4283 domain-containing protein n=1 Tax=Thlaspi arvense TaxID=13288 RepID=A0AAU9RV70_THLAR|nr:unnamed protein product [Thlaspi arvense]
MVRWSRSNTRDPFLESGIIIGVKDADCLFCFSDRQRTKTMTLRWLVRTTQNTDNGKASCWNHFETSGQRYAELCVLLLSLSLLSLSLHPRGGIWGTTISLLSLLSWRWEMEFCKVSCLFCYGGSVDGRRVLWNPLLKSRVFKIVMVFKGMIRIMAINCDSEISHLSINDGSRMAQYYEGFTGMFVFTMSQGSLMASGGCNKSKDKLATRLKITVPQFDNTELINAYSRTLIGRYMNPVAQEMKSLLFMLPRIWKVEDRVAGADLGMGQFQFDFDEEEDITAVLQMEPYHFDGWMVVLRERRDETRDRVGVPRGEIKSYKGALVSAGGVGNTSTSSTIAESSKGKEKALDPREDKRRQYNDGDKERHHGDNNGSLRMPPRERRNQGGVTRGIQRNIGGQRFMNGDMRTEKKVDYAGITEATDKKSPSKHSAKKVRKGIVIEKTVLGTDELGNMIDRMGMLEPGTLVEDSVDAYLEDDIDLLAEYDGDNGATCKDIMEEINGINEEVLGEGTDMQGYKGPS